LRDRHAGGLRNDFLGVNLAEKARMLVTIDNGKKFLDG
jgi:hypothetical protein